MAKPLIKIDIVSDVVCPWCYIGKRRLEKAMNQLKDEMVFEAEFHPFELNPTLPAEGVDQKNTYQINLMARNATTRLRHIQLRLHHKRA